MLNYIYHMTLMYFEIVFLACKAFIYVCDIVMASLRNVTIKVNY